MRTRYPYGESLNKGARATTVPVPKWLLASYWRTQTMTAEQGHRDRTLPKSTLLISFCAALRSRTLQERREGNAMCVLCTPEMARESAMFST